MSSVQPTIVKSTKSKSVIKSKSKTVIPTHVWVLLMNAEEQNEPNAYLWDIAGDETAPKHLVKRIVHQMSRGQKRFLHVLNDGPDSMAGLVNEESDSAEERAEEVFEYLQKMSIREFEYFPGVGGSPEVLITMGAC